MDALWLGGFDCVPVPWSAFPGASHAICKCRASEEREATGWLAGIALLSTSLYYIIQIYETMGLHMKTW